MTKQELQPDQKKEQKNVQPPQSEQEEQIKKEPTLAEEILEAYRKLEKARDILYTAGNIGVGATPNEVLVEKRAYRLLHYQQMVSKTARTPILVVYALINRSYVLDLQPDKSWIRSLLSQGFDVYLVDWKAPTAADKYVSFDDYVNCYIDDCVEAVLKKNKVEKLTLHGYCMGGTMSTMYTALHQDKVSNLAVIAPVIDGQKDFTVIGNLAKNMDVDKMLQVIGNLQSEQLYALYLTLKPFKQGINKYLNLLQNVDNEQFVGNFLRLEKWLYDTPPIAGETFRQWISDIYQKNLLVKNEMKLSDKIVDLSTIKVPLLNIIADEDHLVSPQCSAPLNDVVSSTDKRLMKFHTGHVGLIASLYSQNNVLPKVGQWLMARSQ
jgi:polyhydroxyalkanoate synthase subunit PhaC